MFSRIIYPLHLFTNCLTNFLLFCSLCKIHKQWILSQSCIKKVKIQSFNRILNFNIFLIKFGTYYILGQSNKVLGSLIQKKQTTDFHFLRLLVAHYVLVDWDILILSKAMKMSLKTQQVFKYFFSFHFPLSFYNLYCIYFVIGY